MHLRNLKSVASSQKRSRNPDHAPFGDIFFTLGGTCRIVDPLAKFKQRSLTHSRNIEGGLKFRKRIRYPDHAPFGGFFTLAVGLVAVDPLAKFNERIASSIPEIFKGFTN